MRAIERRDRRVSIGLGMMAAVVAVLAVSPLPQAHRPVLPFAKMAEAHPIVSAMPQSQRGVLRARR